MFSLYEFDTGNRFGPASEEAQDRYQRCLSQGKQFFMYPYHGYEIRMIVREDSPKNAHRCCS